jgi:peptide/nickel transport system substrate-binding protein
MAFSHDSGIGPVYGDWFQSGGKLGRKPDGDLLKQLEAFEKAKGVPAEERVPLGQEISRLMAENVWIIGTVGVSPALLGIVIKKNNFGNVPDQVVGSTPGQTPGNARPEQFYFKA